MIKDNKKISILDYAILFSVFVFFTIVYLYAYVIWPKEEKFRNIDRSRMERIDNAQQLCYDLTNDYIEDGDMLFALMESVKDTLYGDSLFEGEKDILLAKRIKKYIIKNPVTNSVDSIFVNASVSKSFEFSEGVKLFSYYVLDKMDVPKTDFDSIDIKVKKMIVNNLIRHTSPKLKPDSSYYSIYLNGNEINYSMIDYNNYIESNIYSVNNNQIQDLNNKSVFYRSLIDGRLLVTNDDLKDNTIKVNIPFGFKNKLDTTFTDPVKIETFYEDSIYAVKLLSLDPTDQFLDINDNGKIDFGEKYYDITYVNSQSLSDYKGEYFEDINNDGIWNSSENFKDKNYNGKWDSDEKFTDSNNNGKWDHAEKFTDSNNNGVFDSRKISYLGLIPNQDTLFHVNLKGYKDSILVLPSYKYKKYYNSKEIISLVKKENIDYRIVSRKMVDMNYFIKADTLSSDSLYSSINYFKHNFNKHEPFLVKITRFDDSFHFFDIDKNSKFENSYYNESNTIAEIDLIKKSYDKKDFIFELPLVSEIISVDLFYEKLDPPNIVISSPVPENKNWMYWQNLNLVSIEDVNSNNFNKTTFKIPTPFSFYTGSHGEIVNHVKTWINE
ncbi:MAG: hypothetical protein CMG00_04495 [Candidatus Marinimicrobia bacterium]|nr:hypothetical protein [Candidatus Neomarinimicrobiota bacterium]